MPFRLTRQLRGLLRPLGSDALLVPAMAATMASLREQRDVLLRSIEIFVSDPITDWAHLAKRLKSDVVASVALDEQQQPGGAPAAAATAAATTTRARVQTVRYKLDLCSPNFALARDLRMSVHAPNKQAPNKYFAGILKTVAPPPDSERARAGDRCRDVFQQVRCLIELATSDNVLSHTYGGWGSFV